MPQTELEHLRAALSEIASYPGSTNDDAEPLRQIARRALDPKAPKYPTVFPVTNNEA